MGIKYEGRCGTILSGLNKNTWQPVLKVVMIIRFRETRGILG
jgi:hypothetical protein